MKLSGNAFPMRGFTAGVGWANCLAIESKLGCDLQVLSGQAWITIESEPQDVIVNAHQTIQLRPGVRYMVSALHDKATVLIKAPRDVREVDFSWQMRDGASVLSVIGRSRPFRATPSSIAGAIASAARRWLDVAPAASA